MHATIYNSKCVCVSVSVLSKAFKLSLGCVFSPHHINPGGVQEVTPLYEPHTAEECLGRHRSGRHSQVLPGHAGQARELLHVL